MYSRSYSHGDISAKITPPPAYSGSAIQGEKKETEEQSDAGEQSAFAPFSQNIALAKSREQNLCESSQESPCAHKEKNTNSEQAPEAACKDKGLISSLFHGLSTEDLILIGIIIALAFDLAERDILLVALVVAAVIM